MSLGRQCIQVPRAAIVGTCVIYRSPPAPEVNEGERGFDRGGRLAESGRLVASGISPDERDGVVSIGGRGPQLLRRVTFQRP